ncbi:MAG: hypothetical protein Q9170_003362 [Blastenia crenularia]
MPVNIPGIVNIPRMAAATERLQQNSILMSRPLTFRVENIPPGTSANDLKQCFYTEDQPQIEVRSMVPAVDNYELDIQELTATITFQPTDPTITSPRVADDTISIDSDFHGFTPLYHPQEAIAADSRLPVRSIIFLGAPHKGLHITALETLVESQPTEDMVRELKAESPTLTELNDKFRYVAKDMDILTCYELGPTKTAIKMPDGSWKREGPPEMMVSLDSARQWYPREKLVACNADHSQIAKLKRGESGIWPEVRGAIKKAMLSAGDLYSDAEGHPGKGPLNPTRERSETNQDSLQALDQHGSMSAGAQVNSPAMGQSRSYSADAPDWQRERPIRKPININRNIDQWQSGLGDHERSSSTSQFSSSSYALTEVASSTSEGQLRRPSDSMTSIATEAEKVSMLPRAERSTSQADRPILPEPSLSDAMIRATGEKIALRPRSKEKLAAEEHAQGSHKISSEASLSKSAETTSEPLSPFTSPSQKTHHQPPPAEGVAPKVVHAAQGQKSRLGVPVPGTRSENYALELTDAIFEDDLDKVQVLLTEKYDANCRNEFHITPLHDAVKNNRESIVRELLKQGANPKAKDLDGRNNLHRLSELPRKKKDPQANKPLSDSPRYPLSESLIDLLVPHCIPVDDGDKDGYTPLMCAATAGEEQLVIKLIEHGADVTTSDNAGITALHAIVTEGRKPEMINLLISKGAHVDAETARSRATPLHTAGKRGPNTPYPVDSVGMMERLLQAGANIEARDEGQRTPLMIATFSGKENCVSYLLETGANIEAEDNIGMTSLHYAAEDGIISTATSLIERGANKEAQTKAGYTPLHCAANLDKPYVVALLIEHGANTEAEDQYSRTPLHHAAYANVTSTVAVLLEQGANQDAEDQYGFTPLLMAAERGNLSSARELVVHGADKEAQDLGGLTALCHAVRITNIPLVKLLLEHGANPETTDKEGRTALHQAISRDNLPLMQLLIKQGVNKEAADKEGRTTLHQAVQANNLPPVQLLIKEGANLEALDRRRYTPLDYTILDGNLTLAELLIEHGANLGARYSWGRTTLHLAVVWGDIRMVKLLLKHGADPCARATNSVSSNLKSIMGGGGTMPRGFNETHRYECPDAKRDKIKRVLKEAEKARRIGPLTAKTWRESLRLSEE